ncbi:thaumatin-like protein [Mycena olivaceomarginata]|nr:thaumatin-like protein [Mycena olivaceomarginata]KAJ7861706.1 thaumatin-like protein [Mycena olivaceomarginata]
MKSFITVSLAMVSGVAARSITVYNGCPFTIWPAYFTSGGARPSHVTGWAAGSFTKEVITVDEGWFGRIWARRNCDFSKTSGPTSCLDGGCLGGLVCDVSAGTGVPPASLAEFNFQGPVSDFYDISFVDGYNLPIRIDNSVGCPAPGCNVDLGPNCPASQKGPFDASGFPVGCSSSCNIDALNGRAGNSPNCCSGQFDKPETCPSSGVLNYHYFKDACPNAYAYAYDERSESALWTCPTPKRADYTVTFCP